MSRVTLDFVASYHRDHVDWLLCHTHRIPIGLLTYVQIKNFLSNRTTNERLTNKVYKRRKLKSSSVADADSEHSGKRSGSMASSVFTTTTSLLAEDVVMDLGSRFWVHPWILMTDAVSLA